MENKEYWEKKEMEIQEKIIHKCMVQYLDKQKNVSSLLWSLFFYSEQAIYLTIYPQKNLLLSMLWVDNNSEKQSLDLRIPWNDITKISFPEEKSKIKKLFSPHNNLVIIDCLLNQNNISLNFYFIDSINLLKKFIAGVNKKLLD